MRAHFCDLTVFSIIMLRQIPKPLAGQLWGWIVNGSDHRSSTKASTSLSRTSEEVIVAIFMHQGEGHRSSIRV